MNGETDARRFGLGLRKPHYGEFTDGSAPVDFVEVISENFMVEGGRPLVTLSRVREHYPVALHGVSMSLGSVSGVNVDYLARLRSLIERIEPLLVSDHLSWTGFGNFNSHDLLPLPYDDEAFATVERNILDAQELLGRQILIENPSSYIRFEHSTMAECEFIRALCRSTGCALLLDVNNVFVSAMNHGFDPVDYIRALGGCDVQQIHLAGHDDSGPVRIDTHDRAVSEDVWKLYRCAATLFPEAATMIERDDDLPPLQWLLSELGQARSIAEAPSGALPS